MKRFIQSLMFALAVVLGMNASAQVTDTVFVGTGTSGTYQTPYNHYYVNGWHEMRYDASAINMTGAIYGIAFDVQTAYSTNCTELNVYMGVAPSGTISSSSDWTPMSDLTLVYSGTNVTIGATTGREPIQLQTPFVYDGSGALVVVIANKVSSDNSTLKYRYTSTANHEMYHRSDTDPSYFNHPGTATGTRGSYLANIAIAFGPMDENYCYPVSDLSAVVNDPYSATVSWTDAHEGSAWLIQYGTSEFTPDAASATSVTSTSHTLTGLTASTTYYVAVATNCGTGNVSNWATTTFTTPTDNIVTNFPWSDDFSTNDGWDLLNGSQTNAWYINNGELFVSNDNGATNAYTNNSISYTWAVRTLQLAAGDYIFSYDWKCQGEGNWDLGRCFLVPGSVALAAGNAQNMGSNTNTTPNGWISLGGQLQLQNTWQTANGSFTIPTDGIYQLAFFWKNDGDGGTNPPASIDNIEIARMACPQPTGLSVSNITAYTVDLDWTPAGTESTWRIICGNDTIEADSHPYTITGLTQHTSYTFGVQALCGSDEESFVSTTTATTAYACPVPTALTATASTPNSITVSWTAGGEESAWVIACNGDTVNVYENPYTITDLNPSTSYPITLWADCGDVDGVSLQSVSINAATECVMITEFPWTENFDGVQGASGTTTPNVPTCWNEYTQTTNSSYVAYPIVYLSSTYARSGSNSLRFYVGTAATFSDQIAVLPEMQNLSGKMISFWGRAYQDSHTNYCKVAVGVCEDFDHQVYTWLDTVSVNSTEYQLFEIPLNTYQGNGTRIALCGIKPASTYCSPYIDDITVDELPTCFHPNDLTLTAATADALTVNWTPGSEETKWEVSVNDNSYIVMFTPFKTITGLDANTAYEVSVRAICSVGDTSDAISATFRTECAATQALPYSEDFNSYPAATYSTVGSAPNCWTTYSNGTDAAYTPHVANSGSCWYSPDGSGSLAFTSGNSTYGDTSLAILPAFETPVNELQLSFTYRMESATYGTAHVGYMVDGEFVSSETLTGTTSYTTGTFTFANAPATATNLAILWYHNSSFYSFGVDDVEVTLAENQGGNDTTGTAEPECAWNTNVAGQSYQYFWKQDHTNGIYNYAEKFTNSDPMMVDTITIFPYKVVGTSTSAFTMAVYDADATGKPGNMVSSMTINYSDLTNQNINQIALPQAALVTGDYFVVVSLNPTPETDTLGFLSTGNRTDNVNTAYAQYNGNWYGFNQLFTPFSDGMSFFITAHACPVSSTETYTVTVAANDATMGTVTGGGEYDAYETVTLTATANAGYYFSQWNDGNTDNPRTITVLSDATFTAVFEAMPTCQYALPYTCSFETLDDQLCWNAIDGDGDGENWTRWEGSSYANTGNSCMVSESYSMTTYESFEPSNWLISPELTIPAEGATLTWYVRGYNSTYYQENYKVLVSSTGSTDTLSFTTQLYDGQAASGTWTPMTAQITTPGTVRIAFVHYNTYDVWALLLDDISVVANEPATTPCDTVTNLMASEIDYSGAHITWSTTADSCQIELREMPNGQWMAQSAWGGEITDSYWLYGLDENTTYQVRVRAICDENVYSEWSTISFTTDNVPVIPCVAPTIDTIVPGIYSAELYWSSINPQAQPACDVTVLGTPFDEDAFPIDLWDSPATITGLMPNTTYQIRVYDFCGWDDVTDEEIWSDYAYATFTTDSAAAIDGVTVPFDGSSVYLYGNDACGINIYDCAGEGDYFNNAEGYLYLIPNEGDTLTLWGDYATEENYDVITIYEGDSEDALAVLSGEGTLDPISTTSYFVIAFYSDGSYNDAGFLFHTSCTAGQGGEVTECDPIALPYATSFEADDESVDCWVIANNDTDDEFWSWMQYTGADYAHSGEGFMYSLCYDYWYYDSPLIPEDWLISPAIIIPEGGATISWWAAPDEDEEDPTLFEDHYTVKLSATGSEELTSFTETLFEETFTEAGWKHRSVFVPTAGTVRFAFIHHNCGNATGLSIDDVEIVAGNTIPQPEMFNIQLLAAVYYPAQGDTLFIIAEEANITGAGEYEAGAEATLNVTPLGEFANVTFTGWQDGNTDMPRTITVTEDAIYTAYFSGVREPQEGIDGVESASISLYPNPATEQVTVTGYEGTIYVLDMTGRVVLTSETNVLDIRNLASGAYFVKAGAQVKKLVVK